MAFAKSNGARVHYELSEAAGETLAFIPGLGLPGQAFAMVAACYRDRYSVIEIDPRGAGKSDAPYQPYSAGTMVADVEAVLDHATVEAAHLIGLSMGGMIAQELALRSPSRVRSLTLLATYAAVDEWSGRCMRLRRRLIEELGLSAQFELSLLLVSSPLTVHRSAELVASFEGMLRSDPPPVSGYLNQLDFCLDHDTRGRLGEITIPTLVITGRDDILTPPHQGAALARAIPGAIYREISEASHSLIWEQPRVVCELIDSFLERQAGGVSGDRVPGAQVIPRPLDEPSPLKLATEGPP
jgi:3-oxoadipate enol-lactonase